MRRILLAVLAATTVATAQTAPPPLELLAPRAEAPAALTTTREFVHVLGRTAPGATVRVGGEPVTVHATGVFARDRVPLARGANRISIEATLPGATATEKLLDIERLPPPTPVAWPTDRLFIDGSSLRPTETQQLAPGEALEVAARATPGQRVEARWAGSPRWWPLTETSAGRYRALLALPGADDIAAAPVLLRISATALPKSSTPRQITVQTAAPVGQWRHDAERLFSANSEGAALLHGLHDVRLGGPFLAELPAGTLLQAVAQQGEHLRVQLSPGTFAWVASSSVTAASAGTPRPWAHFTSLSVSGSAEGDVVNIPLNARVPYAVNAVSDSAGRMELLVDVYSAHHATTWITHRATTKVVREVTAAQAGTGQVRVRITPLAARLWGWRVERTATALRITLRPAPTISDSTRPLAGLRVALEAGHGSADNLGAVGATGVPEKDVNRWTVQALQAELENAGANVVLVREGDDNPNLRERARRAADSQAQLFISVHANSTDPAGGYLRVSGASTFYKHGTGRELAAAVQRQVLAQTGLDDFGLVGNFNYTPMRLTTWMPAVLVEQAFMSHPGDEAKLLDPAFRALLARAVRLGVEDFLRKL